MEMQQQQKEQVVQHPLKVGDGQICGKDDARQQKMQHLQQVTRRNIEIKEQQLQKLDQQLTASQQITAQLKEMIEESEEEKKHLRQELDKVLQQSMVTQKGKPCNMVRYSW